MNFISINENVKIGKDCEIEDFVIIGFHPKSKLSFLQTEIGNNALFRSHTIIYAGNTIGNYFQTGHFVLVREENEIGDNVSIGSGSVIEHHIKIEKGVRIHSKVFIPEFSILEENCWIGPNVVFTNAKYPRSPQVKESLKGVHVKKNAKIGANSTLLPGITIGENSLIGAGSVVTKDVPPNVVVVGNPAIIIKNINQLPY